MRPYTNQQLTSLTVELGGAVTRVMWAIGELGQLHDLPADIRGLVLAEDDVGPYEYLV